VIDAVAGIFSRTDGYTIAKAAWPKPPAYRRARPQTLGLPGGDDAVMSLEAAETPKAIGPAPADAPAPPPPEVLERLGAHTYGEIDARGFADILAVVRPREGEVFVDLGSGTGKVCPTVASVLDMQSLSPLLIWHAIIHS
jgi:hypothetical protein